MKSSPRFPHRGWSSDDNPAKQPGMASRNSMAGGFFLMAAILIGFGWGASNGDPVKGAIMGTAVGAGIAVLTWLLDRRKG